jgi:TRAP-type mannitol/chloroaromatic compound transport system permease small subunit
MRSAASTESHDGAMQAIDPIPHEKVPPRGPWGERLFQLTKIFALAGGVLFLALVALSLVSIIGRKLFSMPVPGDIELMQMGTAIASATLLGYCEMTRKHLRVDFFTANMRRRSRNMLDAITHFVLALIGFLVAWRTAVAAIAIYDVGETSMMLGWPVWPATALIVPCFIVFAFAGLYNAAQEFRAAGKEDDPV